MVDIVQESPSTILIGSRKQHADLSGLQPADVVCCSQLTKYPAEQRFQCSSTDDFKVHIQSDVSELNTASVRPEFLIVMNADELSISVQTK